MKILLPDTLSLDPVLPPGWQAVTVDAQKPIPHEQDDAEALVIWGSTPDHILSASRNLHRLRFVQTLSAGADVVVDAGFNSDVILAAGSGLHDQTVAEHTMALLLSLVRELPIALHCQERHEWSPALGGVRDLHPSGKITTLLDTRTLILGFGRIGQTLARILQQFGSSVTGVARSTGERAGFPVIALEAMMAELPRTDILISLLPGTTETQGLIGAPMFGALPNRALFLNVGRGSVVDQDSLARALRSSHIAGAALDVTAPEPLPPEHPLWDVPGLIITPHAAGGRPVGAARLIERNIRALADHLPIENLVTSSRRNP